MKIKLLFIVITLFLSINIFCQSLNLNCVNFSGKYKVKKAYIWVEDSLKMEVPFAIDFKITDKGLLIKLYIPGNSTNLLLTKDSVLQCNITENNNFKASYETKVIDMQDNDITYFTVVSCVKKNENYIVTIESIGADKSKMEILLKKITK